MFLQNKYTTWYNSIITKAQSRSLLPSTYVERHHIIPKSIGGLDCKENLISLTAREHFVCHLLLPKMLTGKDKNKMIYAMNYLLARSPTHQRHIPNSSTYQRIKEQVANLRSAAQKGVPQSAESNKKRSITLAGRKSYKRTPEIISKLKESKRNNPQKPWNKGGTTAQKGKTYEEIYGEERGQRLRKLRADQLVGKPKSEKTRQLWSTNRKGKTIGAKNSNAKPITINGISYGCKQDACAALNLSMYKLNKLLA